jgi:glycosyltransferase involved in cell wall biosynthesis
MKMCQAFTDNGHELILLAPDQKEKYENSVNNIYDFYNVKGGFRIIKLSVPKIRVRSLVYTYNVFKQLLLNKPDLVYGRCDRGCYISALMGFKTIFESHDPMRRSKKFHKLMKNKNLIKIVAISQVLKKRLLAGGHRDEDKIQVAHDGADEADDLETKAELGGDASNLKIGYVGNLYHGKGMEIIERIVHIVPDDIEFHIIGGQENDIEYWKSKIRIKNVYFHGFVPQSKIGNYINALDICMLPNQKVVYGFREGKEKGEDIGDFTSPLKMFEYMAHGKPIIASNLKVLNEVLNEENAVLVDPENETEWVDAIDRLKDRNFREAISRKALEASINYTWKNRAKNIIDAI